MLMVPAQLFEGEGLHLFCLFVCLFVCLLDPRKMKRKCGEAMDSRGKILQCCKESWVPSSCRLRHTGFAKNVYPPSNFLGCTYWQAGSTSPA